MELLAFVSEEELYGHLLSSDLVINLTENDDWLVCGAYEAMAAGKSTDLSRKPALEAYFTDGTVFTENRPEEIVSAARRAYEDRVVLWLDYRDWVETVQAWCGPDGPEAG